MFSPAKDDNSYFEELLNKYDSLEKRIALIESKLGAINFTENQVSEEEIADFGVTLPPDSEIEVKIGSHGLAWLGNIVLIFGITFLMTYAQNLGYSLLSSLLGYILVFCRGRRSLCHFIPFHCSYFLGHYEMGKCCS